MGDDAVIEALPYLQPAALSRELRPDRRHRKERSKEVAAVRAAAAAATGTDEPPLQELHRVSGTNLMMAIGTLIAVFALLSQVGSPQELWDTITSADLIWLIIAMIISLLTNFATAVALMGTVPINLPLIRTAELQLSMSFSNLAVPAIGGMAAQIRFLQKQGVDLASAVASGGLLINVGNIVAQVMLLGVAILLSPTAIHVEPIDTQKLVTLVLLRDRAADPRGRARARHPEAAQRWSCRRPRRRPRRCGRRCARRGASCCSSAATRSTR